MTPGQTEAPDDGRASEPTHRRAGRTDGNAAPAPSAERRAIERLLAERGVGRHALFLTQREGTLLPGGLEAVSGFVLDERSRVHGFWLAWDDAHQALTLDPFYPVRDPEREFADDAEYRSARRALGRPGLREDKQD
jgi:hypothetical protein